MWKRFIDDVFSLWNISAHEIEEFIHKANSFHQTIKFTAEISETEITFLDTKVYRGDTFHKESVLDVQTYYKPTETFEYTNFYSCHPPGVTQLTLFEIKEERLRELQSTIF